LILRDGHREIPCCLQIRFIVVGQTVKQEHFKEQYILIAIANKHPVFYVQIQHHPHLYKKKLQATIF
jgi:hypothetical protein